MKNETGDCSLPERMEVSDMAVRRKTVPFVDSMPPTPIAEHIVPCEALVAAQVDIAGLRADIQHFYSWEEKQNGSLDRIEKKVDKLLFRIIAVGGGLCVCLIGFIIEQACTK